jgi:hypothetical protein
LKILKILVLPACTLEDLNIQILCHKCNGIPCYGFGMLLQR